MTGRDWEVLVAEVGRSGTVTYREPSGSLQFYWEFGGGDAVATILVGTAAQWGERYAWAAPRRDQIIQRVIDEVTRQRAPTCSGVLDEQGWITLYQRAKQSPGGSSPRPSPSPPPSPSASASAATQHLSASTRRARIVSILTVAILALTIVAWLGRSALQIKTTGAPWGSSMRAGNTVITLMTRLEPYVPSLNRNAGKDRYTVGLLLHEGASGNRRYVELARGRAPNDLSNAKLLAVQGARVWVQVPETMMVDVASGRVTGAEELQRDPSLAPPERRFSISDLAVGDRATLMYLAAGGQVAGTRWLGVHATADLASSFRVGFRAPAAADFDRSADPRRLYTGTLTVERSTTRFAMLEPTGVDSLYNGALVRAGREGGLLELADGGWLMVHETRSRRAGTVVVSRVDATGKIAWQVDSGIGELLDVLPDTEWPAFVGQRPRVPDRAPEPILAVVDAKSGRVRTWSLWMRD